MPRKCLCFVFCFVTMAQHNLCFCHPYSNFYIFKHEHLSALDTYNEIVLYQVNSHDIFDSKICVEWLFLNVWTLINLRKLLQTHLTLMIWFTINRFILIVYYGYSRIVPRTICEKRNSSSVQKRTIWHKRGIVRYVSSHCSSQQRTM